jgi:DNA-binding PucR family transcriptional regulator
MIDAARDFITVLVDERLFHAVLMRIRDFIGIFLFYPVCQRISRYSEHSRCFPEREAVFFVGIQNLFAPRLIVFSFAVIFVNDSMAGLASESLFAAATSSKANQFIVFTVRAQKLR